MAHEIVQGVHWIGTDNPTSRDFHGVRTPRGGSYNSYLILDERPALVDLCNTPFLKEYLGSLSSVIDPSVIRYIIVNHAEPDHSGAIADILGACPNATIVCTGKCKEFLTAAFGVETSFETVQEGSTLSLGRRTLSFLSIPMVHWPECMMTYLVEDKILFSSDLFGTEVSHEHVFADQMEPFDRLTRDYFAIVMRPFAPLVKRAVDHVRKIEVAALAPSHGPVYRTGIPEIIATYERYATRPEEHKVLIVYYSVWHSTERMAQEIQKGVESAGWKASLFNLASANLVELMAEAMTSTAIAFGSLTLAGSYHPLFDALFPFLKLNNQKGKHAAVFGTHGWVPAAVPKLTAKAEELGYVVVGSVDLRFGPHTPKDITRLQEFGTNIVIASRGG